jgi:hypothetical protein
MRVLGHQVIDVLVLVDNDSHDIGVSSLCTQSIDLQLF